MMNADDHFELMFDQLLSLNVILLVSCFRYPHNPGVEFLLKAGLVLHQIFKGSIKVAG